MQVHNNGRLTPELEKDTNKRKVNKVEICEARGCHNRAVIEGYCRKHYERVIIHELENKCWVKQNK